MKQKLEDSKEDNHSSAKSSTVGKKGKHLDSDVNVNVDISTSFYAKS